MDLDDFERYATWKLQRQTGSVQVPASAIKDETMQLFGLCLGDEYAIRIASIQKNMIRKRDDE